MLANLKTFGCLVLEVNFNGFPFFFFKKDADYSNNDEIHFLNLKNRSFEHKK